MKAFLFQENLIENLKMLYLFVFSLILYLCKENKSDERKEENVSKNVFLFDLFWGFCRKVTKRPTVKVILNLFLQSVSVQLAYSL